MPYAQFQHSVKHPSLDRFESVPCVRQRPSDYDAHSVIQIALFYLLFQRKGYHLVDFEYTRLFIFVIHFHAPELLNHMTSGGVSAALS